MNGITQVGGAIILTQAAIGLGDVNNTSDANKPISKATQTALTFKADLASPALTGVPVAPTPSAGDNTTQIATTAFVTNAVEATTHAIGDSYGGGIVFYVYDGGRHGLIAARADQIGGGVIWGHSIINFARRSGIGAGEMNTAIILSVQASDGANDFAARFAAEYRVLEDGVTACSVLTPPPLTVLDPGVI